MRSVEISRRRLVARSAAGLFGVAMAGCGSAQPPPAASPQAPASAAPPTTAAKSSAAAAPTPAAAPKVEATTAPKPQQTTDMVIMALPTGANIAVHVSVVKGLLAQYGIRPDLQRIENPPAATQLLVGNKVHLITGAPSGALNNAILRGAPIVAVASTAQINPKYRNGYIIVSDKLWNDGVRSVADLKGRNVAIQLGLDSSFGRLLVRSLEKHGLVLKDIEYADWLDAVQLAQAAAGGQIEAMITAEPRVTLLKRQANMHPIFNTDEIDVGGQVSMVMMNREWVDGHKEATIGALMGYLEGIKYYTASQETRWKTNPDVRQIIAEHASVPANVVDEFEGSWFPPDGRINIPSVRDTMEYFKSRGAMQEIVPVEKYVDESFVIEAYRRLKAAGKL